MLLLLAFVATDYVVTQNLSVADAAEHLSMDGVVDQEPAVRVFLGRPSLFWAAGRDRRLYQAGPVEMLSLPPSLPPPYLILSAGPP